MHEDKYEFLTTKCRRLIASELVGFDEVAAQTKIMGVYIVFSPDDSIIYIGSTNNFKVRFGIDLKHEVTHTLMRKLLKDGSFPDRAHAKQYLINNCLYKTEKCSTKREAEALEHLAIWILNPKYNK